MASIRVLGLLVVLAALTMKATADPYFQQQFLGDVLPAEDCELICRGFCIRNGAIGGASSLGSGCNRECDCAYYYQNYPSWFATAPVYYNTYPSAGFY